MRVDDSSVGTKRRLEYKDGKGAGLMNYSPVNDHGEQSGEEGSNLNDAQLEPKSPPKKRDVKQ